MQPSCSPPPKMAAPRSLLGTATMAASLSSPLKSISADGKKWQALRRHQRCRSPLPSPCFFSPCDHICICLRAETLESYRLKTDKDELLRLDSLWFPLCPLVLRPSTAFCFYYSVLTGLKKPHIHLRYKKCGERHTELIHPCNISVKGKDETKESPNK